MAALNIRYLAQPDDPYPPFTLISEPTELARLIDDPSSSDDPLVLGAQKELTYEAEPKTPARALDHISNWLLHCPEVMIRPHCDECGNHTDRFFSGKL